MNTYKIDVWVYSTTTMKTGQHWRRGQDGENQKLDFCFNTKLEVLSFWLNLPWEAGLRWWCTWTKSVSYHDLKKTFLSIFLWFIVFCFCSCLFFHQIIFIKSSAISWPTFFLNRINPFQKHYLQDLELQTVASFQLLLYPKLAFSSSISGKNLTLIWGGYYNYYNVSHYLMRSICSK